jgi:4-aminobutyrate aminotransferase-like enzyme
MLTRGVREQREIKMQSYHKIIREIEGSLEDRETLKGSVWEWDRKHVLGVGLPELGIGFESGEGAIIRDFEGKEYLDFMGQTLNVFVGHHHKKVIQAAIDQMEKLSFCSMLAVNEPKSKLAKLINDITAEPLRMLYTVSGGSEVNESAMKLARRARHKVGGYKFISRLGAYHGATFAANAATGLVVSKPAWVEPLPSGFVHVPLPYCYRCSFGQKYPDCEIECAKIIEQYIIQEGPEVYAGVIMEPILSAKGVVVPPLEYVKMVRDICTQYGIILIFDEIVSGFGRTGKMFAYEHFKVVPDIMTLGKGMSSGYAAISGMVVKEELGKLGYAPNYHGFTMSGYPLANAIAYANIKVIIEDNLTENSAKVGQYLMGQLKEMERDFKVVGDVRGKGLLTSLEIVRDKKSKLPDFEVAEKITNFCKEQGFLFHLSARGDTVNLLFTPPLCITMEDVDRGMSILKEALRRTCLEH